LASVVLLSLVAAPGAVAHSGLVLRGYGTPTIDGVIGAGEWQSTGRFDAPVALPPELGGGTVPATLYLMNDTQNLYIALMVGTASIIGDNSFLGAFDNDHNGTLYEQGHESLEFRRTGGTAQFLDGFIQRLPNGYCWCWDVDYGGTSEITGAYTRDSGASYYELAHPLDTADDGHDFSMRLGRRAGLAFDYIHCVATQCAFTRMPPYASGNPPDVSIVSNDHTPPDTQLTSGPQEGSIVAPADFDFAFTGSDAAISPETLLYECKLDAGAYEPCTSSHRLDFVDDGSHTFSVRALDDWDLADPTPAERHWSVDGESPARPRVIGPRVTRSRTPTYRFAATDAVAPVNRLRYRCAFDRTRLHACRARYRQRLSRGRHMLRVRALDTLGNTSGLTTVHVVVKKPRS
jgi:hypothetical protein